MWKIVSENTNTKQNIKIPTIVVVEYDFTLGKMLSEHIIESIVNYSAVTFIQCE